MITIGTVPITGMVTTGLGTTITGIIRIITTTIITTSDMAVTVPDMAMVPGTVAVWVLAVTTISPTMWQVCVATTPLDQ